MRAASASDFTVQVEDVGTFQVGRRQMKDHLKIQVQYADIVEGVIPTPWLHELATHLSTLRVLVVRSPEGFDLETLDPLDPATFDRLRKVYAAIAAKEDSFRPGAKAAGEGAGQANGGDA